MSATAKTNCSPLYWVSHRTGDIGDDVARKIGTSTSTPLGKPTSGSVVVKHLGNVLNATAPTDSRVLHYAVYRATSNSIGSAVFQLNIDKLPWTDKQSDSNDVINTARYYWLVSLDRNYAHYQTVALDAFYVGTA